MVIAAQQGDSEILNHLLKAYQPFIAKCVSSVCKRYIDPEHDDEFSIGLSAFHSAIEIFSPVKGSSFLSFAKLVITRRVIDDRSEEHTSELQSRGHLVCRRLL